MAENARKTNCWSRRIAGGMRCMTPLSFLGDKLLVLLVISMSLWCLSHAHCITLHQAGRKELLAQRGKAEGCPVCLGLTWKDVKGLSWYFHCSIKNTKGCPGTSTAASRTPLQATGVLRWCFTLSVCGELLSPGHCVDELAESLVYLILNLVLGSSKIGLGLSVCLVWCLNIRDRYRMWRGWIYLHAWDEVGRQKRAICIFPGICDMTSGDMDRDHWSLSKMKCFGYAGGTWLIPKLREAWVGQLLPVAGNRLDLGEGKMCRERQTVLRLLKKKKKRD